MPGSGKSALLKQMRMALAAPGDLCVYHVGTGSETADEHERTLTDYLFQAFAERVASDLEDDLAPSAGSREERLFQDFKDAYERSALPAHPITVKAMSIF